MKKMVSSFLAVLVFTSVMFTTVASASEVSGQLATTNYVASKEAGMEKVEKDSESVIQPNGGGAAVLIFIAGILAGYIIDGILIKTTGYSGGEWVAKALSFNKKQPACTHIRFVTRISQPVCHSGSGGSF